MPGVSSSKGVESPGCQGNSRKAPDPSQAGWGGWRDQHTKAPWGSLQDKGKLAG